MVKKIIVAGAGHGGVAAVAFLAKAGLDVTVYEHGAKGKLGHDWTDIFEPGAWKAAGIALPAKEKYEYKNNMTFYSPDLRTPLTQSIPPDEIEIKMERRDIYEHLISHALKRGVKFVYGCDIRGPVVTGNRVAGIKTDKGDYYADLIIDAAGVNSPVRTNLPAVCGIETKARRFEKLFVYRAFYDNPGGLKPDAKYKVYLLPDGKKGIAWVASEREYTDLLIGRFEPFGTEEIGDSISFLSRTNPWLGNKVLRGGQFTEIPVRQPLAVMVCDGYAAVGDSAFMTIPIIGSGIANSFKAARMLARTVLSDNGGACSANTLWPYQAEYYKQLGAGLGQLACLKALLLRITPAELDYCFNEGVLTAQDFALGSCSTGPASLITISPGDAIKRAQALLRNISLLKKAASAGSNIGKAALLMAAMPKSYNYKKVTAWSRKYRKFYAGLVEQSS